MHIKKTKKNQGKKKVYLGKCPKTRKCTFIQRKRLIYKQNKRYKIKTRTTQYI